MKRKTGGYVITLYTYMYIYIDRGQFRKNYLF